VHFEYRYSPNAASHIIELYWHSRSRRQIRIKSRQLLKRSAKEQQPNDEECCMEAAYDYGFIHGTIKGRDDELSSAALNKPQTLVV
jgi:hypothetical protein